MRCKCISDIYKVTDDNILYSSTFYIILCLSIAMSTLWHLKQEKLESNDQEILTGIEDWVSKAKFEKKNADDYELCVDNGLSETWKVLKNMDLIKKFPPRRGSIVRIPGPKSSPWRNSEGNSFICPIRVVQGKPTISGSPLIVGESTYMTKGVGVDISPGIDILFLLL
ncbi:hypothetical protein ABVK25_010159 [Lepraria finkii]|uniref:Uncharacterized protein n=1 Tax=Lepraria finkii TaxID=1340010 RepID=A0ABR4AV73_9LECA